MIKSGNEKVQSFLEEVKRIDAEQYKVLIEIHKIVINHHPKIDQNIMYGGIVFFIDSELISGLFAYKNHVTIEFSKGYLMKDPYQFLEGKGKYRRHLKIWSKEDIKNKDVAFFVKQAV